LSLARVGLTVNVEKTKYIVMSREQHAEKITTERKVINPLREWSSSHVWDTPLRRQNFIHG